MLTGDEGGCALGLIIHTWHLVAMRTVHEIRDFNGVFVLKWPHRKAVSPNCKDCRHKHLVSGLCWPYSKWLLQLWDQLTKKALMTLKLCQISKNDPEKLAYHSYHGERYDRNRFLLAPPGTRAVIHELPHNRALWGPRGIDDWYCGPSFDHYPNMKFYILETQSYCMLGSFDLFP